MKNIKRIQYIDGFKFSFVLPLNKKLRYQVVLKTTGLNQYTAEFEFQRGEWFCTHCDVHGNDVTIFVKDHNLMPGRLTCMIHVFDQHGHEIDVLSMNPGIELTHDFVNDKPIDDLNLQQSLDIQKLYDKTHHLREDMDVMQGELDEKVIVYDPNGEPIQEMFVSEDDEYNAPVYTKEQCHQRFVSKKEMEKYAELKDVQDLTAGLVDKDTLKNYYNKSEADNKYVGIEKVYTKEEVDSMILALSNRIKALEP